MKKNIYNINIDKEKNKIINKKAQKAVILLILIIAISLLFVLFTTETKSAYFSTDINGINEEEYPGYKELLQELSKTYPNITLFYTGLDWDEVIKNERVHSRNLVPKSSSEEWRCPVCGDKLYDSGWYCASDEAVEYLMDPRVYLNTEDVYQFQKLDSHSGTLNKEAIAIAVDGTFLDTQEAIDAIYLGAEQNSINAFHLITRMIQEQGSSGNTTLVSGKKYTGTDGVIYEGLYNVFNISAYGNSTSEIITNGFKKAQSEGWTSLGLSISGGSAFMKNDYLTKGQNTLYLQKFDVDDTSNGLYWHQYMQNLFGAKSEADILKDLYEEAGIMLNSDFEFVIPIYENMPEQISQEPTAEYSGEINTDLKSIAINGNEISGEILIAEWINSVAYSPKSHPQMTIKSTDGSVEKKITLTHVAGLTYTYNLDIENLDITKDYYIEVRLTNTNNISTKQTQQVRIPEQELGTYENVKIRVMDNIILFGKEEYVGEINTDVKTLELIKDNSTGEYYISGEILIAEWIDGIAYQPEDMPELTVKTSSNEILKLVELEHVSGLSYKYKFIAEGFETFEEYYIEAKLTTVENIATEAKKTQELRLIDNELERENDDRNIVIRDSKITIQYYGEINTDLTNIEISGNNIEGNIIIAEWVDSVAYQPKDIPEMILKSTDGSVSQKITLKSTGALGYSFSGDISDIDTTKEYYLELRLVTEDNISSEVKKIQNAKIRQSGTIGKLNGNIVLVNSNKITFVLDGYFGEINTDLTNIQVSGNNISGNIIIAEWIDSVAYQPKDTPEMILKSTDGSVSKEIILKSVGGLGYSFTGNISDIDTSKEYYLELRLVTADNISAENKKTQVAKIRQSGTIGTLNGKNVLVNSNKITFAVSGYYGEINTDLTNIQVSGNNISGNIIIAEWINSVAYQPKDTPEMILKSIDGTYSKTITLKSTGGLGYSFSGNISDIDTSKEYYLELRLVTADNISAENKKTQVAKIRQSGTIGTLNGKNVLVNSNKITFAVSGYYGEINTDLTNIQVSGNNISGNIIIAEWINSVAYQPKDIPMMTLKSTDGTYSKTITLKSTGGLGYSFSGNISDINASKEYYLELRLVTEENISIEAKKVQEAKIRQTGTIGTLNGKNVLVNSNKITVQ